MGQSSINSIPGRPTNVRYGVLGFACSLSLLTYLDRVCISQVKDLIQLDLGLGKVEMGMVLSAFAVGYALFEIPGGWMGDRWGSRRVITRIVLWWSLFTALTGSVWQPAWGPVYGFSFGGTAISLGLAGVALLLIRFLFGCGEAGAYPNLTRVTGIWFPFRQRAFAQGAVWMSARLGGALAPIVITWLTLLFGWRQAFWALGVAGAAWAVAFYVWFRDRPEEKDSCNVAERYLIHGENQGLDTTHTSPGHARLRWTVLLSSGNAWGLGLAAFFVSFGWYFYPTWHPDYLDETFHISFRDSPLLTGLPFLCGAIGSFVGGTLSDQLVRRTGSQRWGRSLVGFCGFSAAGCCVFSTGFVGDVWQATALLCLAFFVNDLAIPVLWATCTDIGGRFAGTVSGFMNSVGLVGGIVSPTVIPLLRSNLHSWRTVFIVLACSWFAGALCWLWVDASKRLVAEDRCSAR
jgi:MFS family permease